MGKEMVGGKGFFTLIKESLRKISSGCGPGCGCHQESKEEKKENKEVDLEER